MTQVQTSVSSSQVRWVELILAFGVAPLLVALFVPPGGWLPVLWLVGLVVWIVLRRGIATPAIEQSGVPRDRTRALGFIGLRFVASSLLIAVGVARWLPQLWLKLPREHPGLWLAVMLLYPLLSVYPQELIYRRYFFARYADLFSRPTVMVTISALAFSWVHVIFRNPYAIGLTIVGGFYFADTYRRSGSFWMVCAEHAAYGCMVFTLGLGQFFL